MVGTYNDSGIYTVLTPFQFNKGDNLPFYKNVLSIFTTILKRNFEALMAGANLYRADDTRQLASQLNDPNLVEYLLQPEVSHRLLFDHEQLAGADDFFLLTLSAHLAKKTGKYDSALGSRIWSANGDFLISSEEDTGNYETYEAPRVAGRVPIDFFSPCCLGLSAEEIQEGQHTLFDLYSIEEAEQIFTHLEDAVLPLADNSNFHELICLFNNVLMVKKQQNPNGKKPFISGSDGYYIGRTHVMNPDVVSAEPIAEMFVHEAIHSVLYMLEEHGPWMPGVADAHRIGISVPSNWSGNRLSIRSYFQAVFVWFGIWNLWRYARENNLYNQEWIKKRLQFVTNGFATLNLDDIRKKYDIRLPDETVDAVLAAKKIVLEG
ncbi:MAG: hypothetical protein J7623_27665 [Chitinophaga sp.]|uniref:hypothetical protein n=1 Tax=Chitinophaga sp. TaxID=1869181 RepID=UPI001B04A160|nr:hypothetical protein [Chitinophaga sp.]MBO9732451.1 hypothetical protein [Chitinophaga sp.]